MQERARKSRGRVDTCVHRQRDLRVAEHLHDYARRALDEQQRRERVPQVVERISGASSSFPRAQVALECGHDPRLSHFDQPPPQRSSPAPPARPRPRPTADGPAKRAAADRRSASACLACSPWPASPASSRARTLPAPTQPAAGASAQRQPERACAPATPPHTVGSSRSWSDGNRATVASVVPRSSRPANPPTRQSA